MPAGRTGNTAASRRRAEWREEFWAGEKYWAGPKEKGWFTAPRSLPLILRLLETKKVKDGRTRLPAVYLELLSRHVDEGVIEMATPDEHAHGSGFRGTKAVTTWRGHMRRLEALGLLKYKARGGLDFGYVLLAHPTVALHHLYQANKIPSSWWDQYRGRQIALNEPAYEDVIEELEKQ